MLIMIDTLPKLFKASTSGPGTFDGPRRYLEWCRPFDLFLQYQQYAEASGQVAAGFNTFLRIFKQVFQTHLKFRDKAEHAQCDVCWKLRGRIRKAKTRDDKHAATQAYSKHLLSQWLDRQQYWALRSLSRHFYSQALHFSKKFSQSDLRSSLLAMIQDGMDQAKLRVPRFGYQRISKRVEKIYRPALHLVGTWLHGWKLRIAISDEDVKKNSETSIELVTLALCDLLSSSTTLPLVFHLQQDNCYREGKNRFMLNFMLLLTVLGIFRQTSLGFLRTAHSHEDIDQCFGQVARLLMGKRCSCADEMVALLADASMTSQNNDQAGRIRGSLLEAFKIDEISVWKNFVAQTALRFKGLRRVHHFRFCLRKDLGSDVLDHVFEVEELNHRFRPHPDDVFMVTKRWLADTQIMRAIAILPFSTARDIRRGFHPPSGIAARRVISDQVKGNHRRLVPSLRRSGELSNDAADYLMQWGAGTLPRKSKPTEYSILKYRYSPALHAEDYQPGTWVTPRRVAHYDLTLENADDHGADSDPSSSEDEGALGAGFLE